MANMTFAKKKELLETAEQLLIDKRENGEKIVIKELASQLGITTQTCYNNRALNSLINKYRGRKLGKNELLETAEQLLIDKRKNGEKVVIKELASQLGILPQMCYNNRALNSLINKYRGRRTKEDNYLAFREEARKMFEETGTISVRELSRRTGVSSYCIYSKTDKYREIVEEYHHISNGGSVRAQQKKTIQIRCALIEEKAGELLKEHGYVTTAEVAKATGIPLKSLYSRKQYGKILERYTNVPMVGSGTDKEITVWERERNALYAEIRLLKEMVNANPGKNYEFIPDGKGVKEIRENLYKLATDISEGSGEDYRKAAMAAVNLLDRFYETWFEDYPENLLKRVGIDISMPVSKEVKDRIEEVICRLPIMTQYIIIKRFRDKWKLCDISAQAGVSKNTVSTIIRDTLSWMRGREVSDYLTSSKGKLLKKRKAKQTYIGKAPTNTADISDDKRTRVQGATDDGAAVTLPENFPIADLNISNKAKRYLFISGVQTVGEISLVTDKDLLRNKMFGAQSMEKLNEDLAQYGIRIRHAGPDYDVTEQAGRQEAVKKASITELGLQPDTLQRLMQAGFSTVSELMGSSISSLNAARIGLDGILEVRDALSRFPNAFPKKAYPKTNKSNDNR